MYTHRMLTDMLHVEPSSASAVDVQPVQQLCGFLGRDRGRRRRGPELGTTPETHFDVCALRDKNQHLRLALSQKGITAVYI